MKVFAMASWDTETKSIEKSHREQVKGGKQGNVVKSLWLKREIQLHIMHVRFKMSIILG